MTRAAEFHVDVVRDRTVARVTPSGELDASTVPLVRGALDRALAGGVATVVLDMRELTFLDTSGVRMMVDVEQIARRSGVRFAIVDSDQLGVQHVLAMMGVSHLFTRQMP